MFRPARGVLARTLAWAALVAAATASGTALSAEPASTTYIAPRLGPAFRATVERAAQRLNEPSCAAVLTDFVDARTGRPLADTLAESGLTPGDLLSSLYFLDGTGTPLCGNAGVMAHTTPGGRSVLVCRAQFLELQRKDRGAAARVLLHEALHTLGLFENPPHPYEINDKVHQRCGW